MKGENKFENAAIGIYTADCNQEQHLVTAAVAADGAGMEELAAGSLKAGSAALLAACLMGESVSLPVGLLLRKGTLAPRRFQLAPMVDAAAENCMAATRCLSTCRWSQIQPLYPLPG